MNSTRRNRVLRLIAIWGTSLLLSISALGVSGYVLVRDRIDYSCESNGHSYEPRYESVPPPATEIADLKLLWESDKMKAVEKMRRNIYVGDICHYCGKTLKRQ